MENQTPLRRHDNMQYTPSTIRSADISKVIRSIPKDSPAKSEALIRKLHDQILRISDEGERKQLKTELQDVSCRGLKQDLRELLEKRGLHYQGLHLVVNHLTSLPELAEYLYLHPEDVGDNQELNVIKRRLGPDLEVLGALKAANINVTEPWVKRLRDRAPSLRNLPRLSLPVLNDCCKDATPGDMAEVHKLIEVAESPSKQLPAVQQVGNLDEQNEGIKESHLKTLNDARKAMARARELLAEKKGNELTKKLKEIMEILQLSPEAKRPIEGLPPDQQIEKITKIIEENSKFVKTAETYNSFLEVVAKASGGRALCGIYYSKYEPSRTAPRPLLLLPREVTIYNPIKAEDSKYMTFSEKSAAANYIQMIESSSTNIGFGVTGLFGLLTAETHVEMQSDQGTETTRCNKAFTDNASVLLYSWKGKKAFQIEQSHMDVSMTVRKAARAIVGNTNASARQEAASSFLRRYGSHLPAGVHTLGGVFFRIAEATSKSTINTTTLTEAATQQINLQNSVGHKGGSADLRAEVKLRSGSSTNVGKDAFAKREKARVTTSVKSMGPQASDLATFEQRLSYNSTWAIIDRGSPDGYIPVWELLKNHDEEFNEVASLLEATWREEEQRREEKSRKKKEKQIVMEELSNLKAKHLRVSRRRLIPY